MTRISSVCLLLVRLHYATGGLSCST